MIHPDGSVGPDGGFGLVEVAIALILLSVGLLGIAGLVRSVASQTHEARSMGGAALVAQQELEAALARTADSLSAGPDTVRLAGRAYAVQRAFVSSVPGVDRIRVVVTEAGPPGFGTRRPVARAYATERRREPPPLLPPADP